MRYHYHKPLGRSIAIGCIVFTAIFCIAFSILNYASQKNAIFARYRSYITDILVYARDHIDNEDMKKCVETKQESKTYKQTLLFMDRIMNDFSIHYLYSVKPLNRGATHNVMSVFSAEDDYNRYEDPEGNLYLGWVSEDEYDAKTADLLFDVMEQDDIMFFVEKTEWSTDYTGAVPLKDGDGKAYAVLAVDIDITTLVSELRSQVMANTTVILILGIIYTGLFLLWTKINIIHPVRMLEKGVVDYAGRSHKQRSVEALKFEAPEIKTDNEVESLSKAIVQMTKDMQDYVSDIITAEEKTKDMKELADEMAELAVKDVLTGAMNKAAFLHDADALNQEIASGQDPKFGLAMIDMNYLKKINDTFGHEKGDNALISLAGIISSVFPESTVYRLGGDEFGVILRGNDYVNVQARQHEFSAATAKEYTEKKPWKHVSAAIGIALYNAETDHDAYGTLERADAAMYKMKKEMKAERN